MGENKLVTRNIIRIITQKNVIIGDENHNKDYKAEEFDNW